MQFSGIFGTVVAKLAGQPIIPRPRGLRLSDHIRSFGGPKFPGQRRCHFGQAVFSFWGHLGFGGRVGARARDLVIDDLGPLLAVIVEILDATIFVLGEGVVALLIDAEGDGV